MWIKWKQSYIHDNPSVTLLLQTTVHKKIKSEKEKEGETCGGTKEWVSEHCKDTQLSTFLTIFWGLTIVINCGTAKREYFNELG